MQARVFRLSSNLAAEILAGIMLTTMGQTLSADMIELKSGGELRGEFIEVPTADKSGVVQIRTLSGANVQLPSAEVTSITRRPILHEQYEVRRKKSPETVLGQWELAEWCRVNNLREHRQTHLRRVIDIDPDHAEARRLLGFKRVENRWMTQDEIMTARGLVKFKGLYRHPEDVEAQVQKQRDAEAEKSWYPKIKQWSAFVWTGDAGRQQQAMTNLQAIRDPNAVPALQRILGTDNREDARLLYVMLLSNIDDERSRVALVIQSLQDDSVEVRQAAVAAISLNDHERVLAIYIQALRHESNTIVNRAAYALGEVTQKEDWPKVMPLLIEALVTVHYHKAIVPNLTNSYPFTRSGSPAITGYDVLQMMLLGEPPILSRKGPPPPGFPGPLKVANVSQERLNLSVQGALQKLSGKKYRPSIPVWRSWWTTEGMLETIPLSRPLEK